MRKEFEQKEKEKARKQAVHGLFKDKKEREQYGISEKTIRHVIRSIKSYKNELKIQDGLLKDEASEINVDDTWLKLSKEMFESFRLNYQNERLE